jgi:uncharacterized protein (DUF3084 family)
VLGLDESQLGQLQAELDTLENQSQEYQFYATQGTNTQLGQVLSPAAGAELTVVSQDD